MTKHARDIMTADPACCSPDSMLADVAKLMLENDCGEIPVVDADNRVIGVVTDRDIVCRVVAVGTNPVDYTAEKCMSQPVVTVREDTLFDEVVDAMEKHQIRRVPVVDDSGCCVGIIAQADLARTGSERDVAELVREVSEETTSASR